MRLLFLLLLAPCLGAQTSELTLEQVVRQAQERYPTVRVTEAELSAAAANIRLARTSFLPRVDALAQVNRATRNNVFGLLFPNSVIAPISGPVLPNYDQTNVWGNAIGTLVTWEPFDFGLRQANVAVAEAGRERARIAVQRSQLEAAALAADAYLTVLAADETLRAAQASVERSRTLQRIVRAQVDSGLRPGADASRTDAEAAAAAIQAVQAQQAVATARAVLNQFVPSAKTSVLRSTKFRSLPEGLPGKEVLTQNPAAREQSAVIAENQARLKVIDRSYVPRFLLQGTAYGRGTGAHPDGTTGAAFSGLVPTAENWGLGFTVSFPLMERFSLRQQREILTHRTQAEEQRYQQVLLELQVRRDRASAALEAARLIVAQTPIQLQAARSALDQATARYQAGLGTLVEVAENQRLLTQTEIDDALARLNVWRGLLAIAAVQGNLDPFLERARD